MRDRIDRIIGANTAPWLRTWLNESLPPNPMPLHGQPDPSLLIYIIIFHSFFVSGGNIHLLNPYCEGRLRNPKKGIICQVNDKGYLSSIGRLFSQ